MTLFPKPIKKRIIKLYYLKCLTIFLLKSLEDSGDEDFFS